jgi:hypothetical protein
VWLAAIREKHGVPQVLGTDRHYSQGGVELDSVRWDAGARALSGIALGAPGTRWSLAIYIPDGYRWAEPDPEHFHDYGQFSGVSPEQNLLRAHLAFDASGRVNWRFQFESSRRA